MPDALHFQETSHYSSERRPESVKLANSQAVNNGLEPGRNRIKPSPVTEIPTIHPRQFIASIYGETAFKTQSE